MGTQYLLAEQINVCGVDTGGKGKKAKAELCFFKFLRRRLRGSSTDPSPGGSHWLCAWEEMETPEAKKETSLALRVHS